MKRLMYLTMATLTALVILVPTIAAQEMMDESKMMDDSRMMEQSKMEQAKMEQPKMMEKGNMEKGKMETPMTGGPATLPMLLPAAATLLLGSGALTYAVLRRR